MDVNDATGIKRLDDGRLRIRATAKDPATGKMVDRQKTMPDGATVAEAVEMRQAIKEEIKKTKNPEPEAATSSSGSQTPTKIRTVGDYAHVWFSRMKDSWSGNTTDLNQYILETWVQPVIGHIPISEIQRSHVVGWVSKIDNATKPGKSEGYAKKTKRGWWVICRQMLQDMCAEHERFDVTKRVRGPRKEGGKSRERRTLTEPELHEFLEKFRTAYAWRYGEVLCLASTGMRLSELYGLKWDVIDYAERSIEIRRAAPKGMLKEKTKTGGLRTVPMLDGVADQLRAQRRRLEDEVDEARRPDPRLASGLVFPSQKGTPRYGSSIRKPMRKVSDVVFGGDFRVGPQVLRRSFRTIMEHKGVPEGVVESMIGHATKAMGRLYTEVQPAQQEEWHAKGMEALAA